MRKTAFTLIGVSIISFAALAEGPKIQDIPPNNYIRDFVQKNTTTNNENQQKLTELLNRKGFLKGTQYAVLAQDGLNQNKEALKALQAVENDLDTVDQNIANFGPYYQLLDNMSPPNNPPFYCYGIKEGVKGVVDKKPGSRGFAFMVNQNGQAKYYDFIDPITDVGFMGSGAEYVVSNTPNGKVQMAYINKDGKVECLSSPMNP